MNAELVNRIVEQVVATLAQQGLTTTAAAPPPGAASPTPQRQESEQTEKKIEPDAGLAKKTFITAEALARRLAAGNKGGAIELANNEFLTPSAADLAEQKNLTINKAAKPVVDIMRGGAPNTVRGGAPVPPRSTPAETDTAGQEPRRAIGKAPAQSTLTIGLVIDRPNEKTGSAIDSLKHDKIKFSRFDGADCWMENLRAMCETIASGGLTAGVVMAPWAADAMMLANKIKGIRAVQGTRLESVAAALRHFNANVLILEHAASTFHEMRTMIRVFAKDRTSKVISGALVEAVGQIERTQ